jgi:hypothetical protein
VENRCLFEKNMGYLYLEEISNNQGKEMSRIVFAIMNLKTRNKTISSRLAFFDHQNTFAVKWSPQNECFDHQIQSTHVLIKMQQNISINKTPYIYSPPIASRVWVWVDGCGYPRSIITKPVNGRNRQTYDRLRAVNHPFGMGRITVVRRRVVYGDKRTSFTLKSMP